MNLWRELFDPDEPDSPGRRVQAGALELTVLVQVHADLWLWAQQMRTHPGIIAPAGLSRTGLSWVDGHHLWLWIRQRAVDGASSFGAEGHESALQRLITRNLRFATLFLTLGLLAELSSSLMIVRRFRRWVLLGLVGMHVGILYVLDIAFLNNIYLLAVLALPIAELVDRYFAGATRPSAVAPPGAG
jgi:hypothetical protein